MNRWTVLRGRGGAVDWDGVKLLEVLLGGKCVSRSHEELLQLMDSQS